MNIRLAGAAIAIACAACAASAQTTAPATPVTGAQAQPVAQEKPSGPFEWITLGTVGGPIMRPGRHDSANLLYRPGDANLVDVGDGAASEMVATGAMYRDLHSIWISHLHFDHIGGLFGVLGLRVQTFTTTPLTIYGPPGTRDMVNGLIAAMQPSAKSAYGVPGEVEIDPAASIKVVELNDGSVVKYDGFTVTAVANTHYSYTPGSPRAKYFRSLSYRFDLPSRSIFYTGDTGPSAKVEALAKGADMLVTEMIDLDSTLAAVSRYAKDLSPAEKERMIKHLSTQHLTEADVGKLAKDAGVGRVVVTHLSGDGSPAATRSYVDQIQRIYSGPVVIANDMQRF